MTPKINHMKCRRFFSGMLMLSLNLLWLSGCTTQNGITSDPREKMNIASNILAETVYINTVLTECQKLGDDVELEALSLEQDWLLKNWALISAADDYYTEQEQTTGILYEGKLLSLAAVKLAHDAKLRALNELNFNQRTTVNQQKFCLNRLATLAKENMDLRTQFQGKSIPFAIGDQPGKPMQTATIPTLADDLAVGKDPGRTYINLVEQLKQDCPKVELIVLTNTWPSEAYAAYCDGAALALMTCEWGKCERRIN
jgi:hypothetical protein